jgi:hypothetical protein
METINLSDFDFTGNRVKLNKEAPGIVLLYNERCPFCIEVKPEKLVSTQTGGGRKRRSLTRRRRQKRRLQNRRKPVGKKTKKQRKRRKRRRMK